MQPVLDAELARHREYAPALARRRPRAGARVRERELLAERPLTGPQLRAALGRAVSRRTTRAALALRLPLPARPRPGAAARRLGRGRRRCTSTTAESWLGRPLAAAPSLDDVVLRYLAAFGPATVADVAAWSRLTGLREVVERLRPRLRTFRDERGRELFDLPDAPRPDPETPAPPRFLPEYDNVLLSHADRSRFVPEDVARALGRGWRDRPAARSSTTAFVCGVWRLERPEGDPITLAVTLAERLPRRATASIQAEGRRLLRFLAPGAERREVVVRVAD